MKRILAALLLAVASASASGAQELQLDTTLSLPTDARGAARTVEPIGAGPAKIAVSARNVRGGAVVVDLVLRYRVPPDALFFDEVIDRIELTTETESGDVFLPATIDTDEIPLVKIATDDAHRPPHFGRAWIEVEAARDRDAIIRAIRAGDLRIAFSER